MDNFTKERIIQKANPAYQEALAKSKSTTFVMVDEDLWYRCSECGGLMSRSKTKIVCDDCKKVFYLEED